jgi:hypothetical protein
MKVICVLILLIVDWINIFGQERYYFDISETAEAYHKIDLFESIHPIVCMFHNLMIGNIFASKRHEQERKNVCNGRTMA